MWATHSTLENNLVFEYMDPIMQHSYHEINSREMVGGVPRALNLELSVEDMKLLQVRWLSLHRWRVSAAAVDFWVFCCSTKVLMVALVMVRRVKCAQKAAVRSADQLHSADGRRPLRTPVLGVPLPCGRGEEQNKHRSSRRPM